MRKKLDIEDYCRREKKHQWKVYEENSNELNYGHQLNKIKLKNYLK